MIKQKGLFFNIVLLLIISIFFFSCNNSETAILVDIPDEPSAELLPMPKGIISTGSKGNPIDQRIIDNSLINGVL